MGGPRTTAIAALALLTLWWGAPSAEPASPGRAAGEQAIELGGVTFRGAKRFTREQLLDLCPGLRRGSAVSRETLESAFDQIVRAYCAAGYPDCRLYPESFRTDSPGAIEFTLRIEEGRRRVIDRIVVSGGKTRPEVIARITGLRSGEPFDPYTVNEARELLLASGLFTEVGDFKIVDGEADTTVAIEIPVEEAPSSRAEGLLGYSGTEGGALGFVRIDLRNIMGTRREASLRWENSGGGLSSYRIAYREPWLGGLPLSAGIALDHTAQDTTYSTTALSADALLAIRRRLSVSIGLGVEKTALAETAGEVTRRERLSLRAGFELDARDDPLRPRAGFVLGGSGDWGARRDGGANRATETSWMVCRLEGHAAVYRPLSAAHGLYAGAEWRSILTDEERVPRDQLLRFGGASSIRGYREDQFRAEWTALLQLEHRISLGAGGSMLFAFTDLGLVRGGGAPEELLVGYGLGVRATARGSVMGVDFGLGRGDSWSEAKVHVRMTRSF